jgi:hypothetical protein
VRRSPQKREKSEERLKVRERPQVKRSPQEREKSEEAR